MTLTVPFSVYYATRFESNMWSSLHNQEEACDWQAEGWRNRVQGSRNKIAEPDDMDANPYTRYCRDHHLPLGSRIENVSKEKYYAAVILTHALEPLKHIAGTIESLVCLPLSVGIFTALGISAILRLNRLCPSRVKVIILSIAERIQSPFHNSVYVIWGIASSILLSLYAPIGCYYHCTRRWWNIRGFHTDFSRKVESYTGEYVPLWKIYRDLKSH